MRSLLVAFLVLLLGVPLVAATPSPLTKPSVMVYPFSANASSLDREASSRLATIIATQMANTGKIAVVPPPPGTERKDYLTVARAGNADYYVSGYISPLGDGVSVVEQVVSTTTGIVVYSTTSQLQTYADAAGQGDNLATLITAHANRALAAIGTAPPAPSPSAQPSQEAQANLGKLFGRKKTAPAKRAAPAATPSPAPVPAAMLRSVTPAPAAGSPGAVAITAPGIELYAVVPIEGTADAPVREAATQRLVEHTHGERTANAAGACAGRNVRDVLTGTLAVRSTGASSSSATFELVASDCNGKVAFRRSYTNDAAGPQSAQTAAEHAVDAAAGAFLNPPKRRRR